MSIINEMKAQLAVGTLNIHQVVGVLKFLAKHATDQDELVKLFWAVVESKGNDLENVRCSLIQNEHMDENLKKYLKKDGIHKDLEIPDFIKERYKNE